jgi:hypothetical protein
VTRPIPRPSNGPGSNFHNYGSYRVTKKRGRLIQGDQEALVERKSSPIMDILIFLYEIFQFIFEKLIKIKNE